MNIVFLLAPFVTIVASNIAVHQDYYTLLSINCKNLFLILNMGRRDELCMGHGCYFQP